MKKRTLKVGSVFKTQDGRKATLVLVDHKLSPPYVYRVAGELWRRMKNGRHCRKCDGLVFPSIVIPARKS